MSADEDDVTLVTDVRRLAAQITALRAQAISTASALGEEQDFADRLQMQMAALRDENARMKVRAEVAESALAQAQEELVRLRDWYQRWVMRDLTERDQVQP